MNDFIGEDDILLERSDAHESRVTRKSIDDDYEKALSIIGFGKFHLILLIICAFANASDAIEILCISFVMPSAECDLKISTPEKGILSSMTFLGMMIGGFVWGTLSDISGRKYTLFLALLLNSVFAILSGLSQTFFYLLLFRFLSGIGVGGSVPVVWSYFSEFIAKNIRGRMICTLASSWLLGNLLVILLAYTILNQADFSVSFLSGLILINDWRLFMIACAVPSLITAFLVLLLPESPKFCVFNRRQSEAKKILVKIYNFNHRTAKSVNKKDAIDHFDKLELNTKIYFATSLLRNEDDDNDDTDDLIIDDRSPLYSTQLVRGKSIKSILKYYLSAFFRNIAAIIRQARYLFKPKLAVNTCLILFIMFALCFGYYGLWIWLPELYKRMAQYGGSPCRPDDYFPPNNTQFDVSSSSQNQSNCHIENSVFLSSFYSAMSNLPGNLFTILFIDKMGRNVVTSISLILSGLSVFGIPFIRSEAQGVLLATIFGGINVITFNSFGCTATELYPTRLRSSALGVQYVAGRFGAILGNILFGFAVDISCFIPLFTVTGLLIVSGLVTLKLPESKNANIG